MAKVLLADDSVTIQKVVEVILSGSNHELKVVSTGEDALSKLGSFTPDIVLADINMPGITGYQLAEEIRKTEHTRHIPVVLLAGAFETIDEALAEKAGVSGSLTKPFEAEDLLGKIDSVLASSGEAEEVEVEAEVEAEIEAEVYEVEGEAEAVVMAEEEGGEFMGFEAMEEAGEAVSAGAAPGVPSGGDLSATFKSAVDSKLDEFFKKAPLQDILKRAIAERLDGLLKGAGIKELFVESLGTSIKDSVEKTLVELIPEIAEGVLKEKMDAAMASVTREVENVIWETVPDLAESLLKKEIEKIRAGN